MGWTLAGGMGPAPLSAQEVAAWQAGTGAELGPIDFQDVLTASRAFVAAYSVYDGKAFDPPWSPPLKERDVEAAERAQERMWDIIMGVD